MRGKKGNKYLKKKEKDYHCTVAYVMTYFNLPFKGSSLLKVNDVERGFLF